MCEVQAPRALIKASTSLVAVLSPAPGRPLGGRRLGRRSPSRRRTIDRRNAQHCRHFSGCDSRGQVASDSPVPSPPSPAHSNGDPDVARHPALPRCRVCAWHIAPDAGPTTCAPRWRRRRSPHPRERSCELLPEPSLASTRWLTRPGAVQLVEQIVASFDQTCRRTAKIGFAGREGPSAAVRRAILEQSLPTDTLDPASNLPKPPGKPN